MKKILLTTAAMVIYATQADATTYVKYTLTGSGSEITENVKTHEVTSRSYQVSFTFYTNSAYGLQSLGTPSDGFNRYSISPTGFALSGDFGNMSPGGSFNLSAQASASSTADAFFPIFDSLSSGYYSWNQFGGQSGYSGTKVSRYYRFDSISSVISSTPIDGFQFAKLVSGGSAVPEPATWAMFIGGFGLIGGAMRRRQRVDVSFA